MGTTEADNVAKVMTVLTNTEINDLSSFVARIARLPVSHIISTLQNCDLGTHN